MLGRWKGMCVLAEYAPDDILDLRGDFSLIFMVGNFPVEVDMRDSRYRVFAQSKCCCNCGLVGTVMRLEYNWHPKGWVEPHFNLYAFDKDGKAMLMTQDHIVPKSKGGGEDEANLITMCSYCNGKKGSKLPKGDEDAKAKDGKGQSHSRPERARAQAAG